MAIAFLMSIFAAMAVNTRARLYPAGPSAAALLAGFLLAAAACVWSVCQPERGGGGR
jgi:hypothetical protein